MIFQVPINSVKQMEKEQQSFSLVSSASSERNPVFMDTKGKIIELE